MDARLVSWARAVKTRGHLRHPVLWLFTDAVRLPHPLPLIARLPQHLCGVVFRHDGAPDRVALAVQVARCCRARGLGLTIAGDWRLAWRLRAGQHIREGKKKGPSWPGRVTTASAHDALQARRAAKCRAVVFLSPVFPSASHPGAPALGIWRWGAAARGVPSGLGALGGIDAATARRLPRKYLVAMGAIGAFARPSLAAAAATSRDAGLPRDPRGCSSSKVP